MKIYSTSRTRRPKQEIATPEPEVDVNQLSDSVEAEIERLLKVRKLKIKPVAQQRTNNKCGT